jgi:ubiquinone/menaquinone biosynthesis C-methylase UbiE
MKYDPIEEEKKWWRQGEIDCREPRPLPAKHHFAHNCVRQKLYETVATWGFDSNSLILELGCGSGEDATCIQKASKNIIGVDISDIALRRFKNKGFQGILANVRALPFRNNSFDCVIASGLLHHLIGQGNLPEYLSEFCRVTKKRGYVIALEPNIFHPSGILMNIFNKVKPGITGLVPHERALSPLYLARVFERAGLKGAKYTAASYVWNRFPLPISQFISKHEDKIRTKRPCNLFGWFEMVYGQNVNLEEIAK